MKYWTYSTHMTLTLQITLCCTPVLQHPRSMHLTQIFHHWHKVNRKVACSAGLHVLSFQRRCLKLCAPLTERAAMWWWDCPTPAASGAAAKEKSAPFVKTNLLYGMSEYVCVCWMILSLFIVLEKPKLFALSSHVAVNLKSDFTMLDVVM